MSHGRRRLAAIIYTDMVGYTALGQRNESLSLALVKESRKLIRSVLNRHHGTEVKTMGDALLVEFPSALDAVRCAYDIQRATREFNFSRSEEERLHLRIGVHLGDVVESQNDIMGDAVNVASRIEPLAKDGGVCLTRQVYDHVQNKFELPLVSLGIRQLKNVSAPIEVFEIAMPWYQWDAKTPFQLDKKRVAVLPFANMSPDSGDEYFADGMTEEIISTLSGLSGLAVISRTSAMQYKGTKKNLVEIGRELGAGTMLEGSVRKAGNQVRITVQLIDALEDKHLWAQKYDRDLSDIFAVQSDIASSVADALRVKMLDPETAQIAKKPTNNMESYILYLRGRQHWNRRSKDENNKALECFQLAVKNDPKFALAYAGIADCYSTSESWGYIPSAEAIPKVKGAVLKAIDLDNGLGEAHATNALSLALYDWNWTQAEIEFKRAIELDPNYASAHQWYAYSVLRYNRRVNEEMREATKALELDPLAPVMSMNMGQSLYVQERYDEAIGYYERSLAIDPDFLLAHVQKSWCYFNSGRHDEAIRLAEKYLPKFNSETNTKLTLVWFYGQSGRVAEAKKLFAEVTQTASKERTSESDYVWACAGLGDADKMFEHLNRMTLEKGSELPWTLVDPGLKTYWSDPRFQDVKKKVGLQQEPLTVS